MLARFKYSRHLGLKMGGRNPETVVIVLSGL